MMSCKGSEFLLRVEVPPDPIVACQVTFFGFVCGHFLGSPFRLGRREGEHWHCEGKISIQVSIQDLCVGICVTLKNTKKNWVTGFCCRVVKFNRVSTHSSLHHVCLEIFSLLNHLLFPFLIKSNFKSSCILPFQLVLLHHLRRPKTHTKTLALNHLITIT